MYCMSFMRGQLHTNFHGKLIDFYTKLDGATRNNLVALKLAFQEKAGLKIDPRMASRNFNLQDQQPNENINDYVSDFKHLFKQERSEFRSALTEVSIYCWIMATHCLSDFTIEEARKL